MTNKIGQFNTGKLIVNTASYLDVSSVSVTKEDDTYKTHATITDPLEDYNKFLGIKQKVIIVIEKYYNNGGYQVKNRYQLRDAVMTSINPTTVTIESPQMTIV